MKKFKDFKQEELNTFILLKKEKTITECNEWIDKKTLYGESFEPTTEGTETINTTLKYNTE